MDQNLTPTALSRDGDSAIEISWSDGTTTRWTAIELRKVCPCATCRDERREKEKEEQGSSPTTMTLPVITAAEARPMQIESMRPVGSYAYAIGFTDGHSSGIFTFPMLYQK